MGVRYMRGVLIAVLFFVLGLLISPLIPVYAEQRLANSDLEIDSTRRVPFENYAVYPDQLVVRYPGLRYAQVASNSMAPIITDKSTVFEKTPTPGEIKENDVISFTVPEQYLPETDLEKESVVLHLVTSIVTKQGKTFYKTQGVANEQEDPWLVPFENVKGIMVGTFR